MGIANINTYFNGFTAGLIIVIVTLVAILIMRWQFQKNAETFLQLLIITKTGVGRYKLVRVKNETIELKDSSGEEDVNKLWPIAEIATHSVSYPMGYPKFMQAQIKQAVVFEWSWEPVSNRGTSQLMTPDVPATIANQKFYELAVTYSEVVEELEAKLQKALSRSINPTHFYILVSLAIVASACAAFLTFQQTEVIEAIKVGIGIES